MPGPKFSLESLSATVDQCLVKGHFLEPKVQLGQEVIQKWQSRAGSLKEADALLTDDEIQEYIHLQTDLLALIKYQ